MTQRTVVVVSLETLETRAAAEAFARLAEKYPHEFRRLYAQSVHPQAMQQVVEVPLIDMNGREIQVGVRVKRPDGQLGRVKRLNRGRRAVVVAGDDGSERFVMAHRVRITSPVKESAVV